MGNHDLKQDTTKKMKKEERKMIGLNWWVLYIWNLIEYKYH